MCRQSNVRTMLLQLPIPSRFNYQPVLLEPNTGQYLHLPLINKHMSLKLSSTLDNQLPKTNIADSVNIAIQRGLSFHKKSSKTNNNGTHDQRYY